MEYSKLEKWLLSTGWRKDALLEWRQPQKAWRILEARWFSAKRIITSYIVAFLAALLLFCVFDLFIEKPMPSKTKCLISAEISIICITVAVSVWWLAPVLMKISNTAITRLIWNDSKCWAFPNIDSYSFEYLSSEFESYTVLVLHKKNGKIWKIALDDSVDKTKLEEILNEHGIQKLEKIS